MQRLRSRDPVTYYLILSCLAVDSLHLSFLATHFSFASGPCLGGVSRPLVLHGFPPWPDRSKWVGYQPQQQDEKEDSKHEKDVPILQWMLGKLCVKKILMRQHASSVKKKGD